MMEVCLPAFNKAHIDWCPAACAKEIHHKNPAHKMIHEAADEHCAHYKEAGEDRKYTACEGGYNSGGWTTMDFVEGFEQLIERGPHDDL
jgi:hypothetical protein